MKSDESSDKQVVSPRQELSRLCFWNMKYVLVTSGTETSGVHDQVALNTE